MRTVKRDSRITLLAAAVTAAAALGATQVAQAQHLTLENREANASAVETYWTPERLASAQPMRPAVLAGSLVEEVASQHTGLPESADGRAPSLNVRPDLTNRLYDPADAAVEAESELEPQNRGALNEDFSGSRLIGGKTHTLYPYRAAGKLFFTGPGGGNFVCSASAIDNRIVVTAGHCVHSGSGGNAGFYTNFLYVPAFKNGAAPFNSWNWGFVVVTDTWANGAGGVPNAADYAMLEMRDRRGPLVLGNVTGFLGWQTLSLHPNHITQLGYPCNLDSCQQMQQNNAGVARLVAPNNAEWGSHMRGGSSGGPIIQNFGVPAAGQTGGSNTGVNKVVGVLSYGYVEKDLLAVGGSIPDARWTEILNIACAHRAGNC
jgi:V8-like Glu-specific endopeptidase